MRHEKEIVGIIDAPRNAGLIAALREEAAEMILFPKTEYGISNASEKHAALIGSALDFDWIVFTDPINAAAFPEEFAGLGKDIYELDEVRVFAAGDAVADQLRFRQIHSDLIEAVLGAGRALEHIKGFLQAGDLAGVRILMVGPDFEGPKTESMGDYFGAEVNRIKLQSPLLREIEEVRLKTLLESGSVDRFILGGAQDVFDLLAVFGRIGFEALFSGVTLDPHGDAGELLSSLKKS